MENNKIRVAITHGDTNGVGYELIFKTFADPEMLELCTPIIYGSPKVAAYHRKALDIQANFTIINSAEDAHDGKVNMLACFDDDVKVDMGTPTPESGQAALRALDRAMTDYRNGAFDVLVSCPLSKDNIHDDNYPFNGLKQYVETCLGDGGKAVSIMLGGAMRVAILAAGCDIKDVAANITDDSISAMVSALTRSARRDFRLSNPRVALLSLNAAADGKEEKDVMLPAISKFSDEGTGVFGPYPAEQFFGTRQYDAFDIILAMYDDQGIVPFRAITPGSGVCYIANLPIVCTAPMQTPQFEIAGKGTADEQSFRHAIFSAIDIFRNRIEYDEPYDNPLQKLYHEKRDETEKARFSIPKKHEGAPKTSAGKEGKAPKQPTGNTKPATPAPKEKEREPQAQKPATSQSQA